MQYSFGFYCQLASRRPWIEAHLPVLQGVTDMHQNILHGQAEMHLDIELLLCWREIGASIPLCSISSNCHLVISLFDVQDVPWLITWLANLCAGKKVTWFQDYEICNCWEKEFLHTESPRRMKSDEDISAWLWNIIISKYRMYLLFRGQWSCRVKNDWRKLIWPNE